jgi:hypothetical protein
VKRIASISLAFPLLASCAQPYAIRFPDCAFPTEPNMRVKIMTARGKTEVHGVTGSRDIVVRGTVHTLSESLAGATGQAAAVKVLDTSVPGTEQVLRLEVIGIGAAGDTRFEAEFLVPRDVRVEVVDGPEDLSIRDLDAGATIPDNAGGDITIQDVKGPIRIVDGDGNIGILRTEGRVRIEDRRGDIACEEVTGDIDIADREGDVLIQSVTGNVVMSKLGRGKVRVNNLVGDWKVREWDNPIKPVFDTIWPKDERGDVQPVSAKDGEASSGGGATAPETSPAPDPSPAPSTPPAPTAGKAEEKDRP